MYELQNNTTAVSDIPAISAFLLSSATSWGESQNCFLILLFIIVPFYRGFRRHPNEFLLFGSTNSLLATTAQPKTSAPFFLL